MKESSNLCNRKLKYPDLSKELADSGYESLESDI